jgi:hypothetical protein
MMGMTTTASHPERQILTQTWMVRLEITLQTSRVQWVRVVVDGMMMTCCFDDLL